MFKLLQKYNFSIFWTQISKEEISLLLPFCAEAIFDDEEIIIFGQCENEDFTLTIPNDIFFELENHEITLHYGDTSDSPYFTGSYK